MPIIKLDQSSLGSWLEWMERGCCSCSDPPREQAVQNIEVIAQSKSLHTITEQNSREAASTGTGQESIADCTPLCVSQKLHLIEKELTWTEVPLETHSSPRATPAGSGLSPRQNSPAQESMQRSNFSWSNLGEVPMEIHSLPKVMRGINVNCGKPQIDTLQVPHNLTKHPKHFQPARSPMNTELPARPSRFRAERQFETGDSQAALQRLKYWRGRNS
eukprot:gnl/MRDRNA2_/MRDRNA2_75645_c0_seq1.p1 gnl/MRDRNA2_/MRDRNA2_75645_c0~~gnl/MRDRNA2_/MRDRNA2_75645_c0_seq1.p1  ORF type:complete len:217 (-),score=24.12 gnl/MRDRNA2_/MRDRNA2_75645_c0_seq1:35-685(-)